MLTLALFAAYLKAFARLCSRPAVARLGELDDRTLADIGIDRSEISSIESEWTGHSRLTRRRIAGGLTSI